MRIHDIDSFLVEGSPVPDRHRVVPTRLIERESTLGQAPPPGRD
ncbi:MAG TPA: hypothetical protein VJL81_06135 [Solirubrobacterales bacterium]|nr:hypothetical protein [Solirubrobacterales bacterium]